MGLSDDLCHQGPYCNSTCRTGKVNLPDVCNRDEVPWHSIIFTRLTLQLLEQNLWNFQQICGNDARFVCAMFYFSLKCYSEDIDKEALLFGTPIYIGMYMCRTRDDSLAYSLRLLASAYGISHRGSTAGSKSKDRKEQKWQKLYNPIEKLCRQNVTWVNF